MRAIIDIFLAIIFSESNAFLFLLNPFDKLHGFEYTVKDHQEYFSSIVASEIGNLKQLFIRPNRYDTIREGALIFGSVLRHIEAQKVITSGVGVREGVFLHDMLKRSSNRFPSSLNPSIQNIRDRLDLLNLPAGNKHTIARKLFRVFGKYLRGDNWDLRILLYALDLSDIGKMLTIYKEHQHASYVAMHELNYGFSHREMLLIALILRSKGKKYNKEFFEKYQGLLPKKKKIKWLIFIYTLVLILYENAPKAESKFTFSGKKLDIVGNFVAYRIAEQIYQLPKPKEIVSIEVKGMQ